MLYANLCPRRCFAQSAVLLPWFPSVRSCVARRHTSLYRGSPASGSEMEPFVIVKMPLSSVVRVIQAHLCQKSVQCWQETVHQLQSATQRLLVGLQTRTCWPSGALRSQCSHFPLPAAVNQLMAAAKSQIIQTGLRDLKRSTSSPKACPFPPAIQLRRSLMGLLLRPAVSSPASRTLT